MAILVIFLCRMLTLYILLGGTPSGLIAIYKGPTDGAESNASWCGTADAMGCRVQQDPKDEDGVEQQTCVPADPPTTCWRYNDAPHSSPARMSIV
jgi:hypothetical protein